VLYPNSLDAVDVTLTDGESSLLYQSFKSATRASPFAIVSACDSASDASQAGRKHGWGIVDVVSNSDVAALRSLLLGPLSEDLRGRTVSVLYDYFRADKFSQLKATPSSVVAPALTFFFFFFFGNRGCTNQCKEKPVQRKTSFALRMLAAKQSSKR